jgi:hypothetical protein
MLGVDVLVSPSSFTVNPGQTQAFSVTFTRTTAALNAYTGGQLTWSEVRTMCGSRLSSGPKYLGSVAYAGIAGLPNPTIVRVYTP